jgi:hypothetical protein
MASGAGIRRPPVQRATPGAPEGTEDAIGLTTRVEDLPGLKEQIGLVTLAAQTGGAQTLLDLCIARACGRIIETIPMDRPRAGLGDETT